MNSYFASVEQQDNPAWRGAPVGVCEHLGGIIIAASVEAKRWGIKTGTPVWEARKLYPKIFLTPTHPERYRFYTRKFLKLVEEYSGQVELYSIDEIFLDATRVCHIENTSDPFDEAVKIAKEIKSRIKTEVGDWLRVSVGVGWNKLVAKIASDYQKPDGLTVFRPEEKQKLYNTLKLIDIPGIGYRQERRLKNLGILTLADLRDYPKFNLIAKFGKPGLHLWSLGQLEGSWKENFSDDEPIKSMGHMYTLPKEQRVPGNTFSVLARLCDMVARRMRKADLLGTTVAVYINGVNEIFFGGSHRLGFSTSDGGEIFSAAQKLLIKQATSLASPVVRERIRASDVASSRTSNFFKTFEPNLISVTMADLKADVPQRTLFPKYDRRKKMLVALDLVTEKYGEESLMPLRGFLARQAIRDSVGFGRVKELR